MACGPHVQPRGYSHCLRYVSTESDGEHAEQAKQEKRVKHLYRRRPAPVKGLYSFPTWHAAQHHWALLTWHKPLFWTSSHQKVEALILFVQNTPKRRRKWKRSGTMTRIKSVATLPSSRRYANANSKKRKRSKGKQKRQSRSSWRSCIAARRHLPDTRRARAVMVRGSTAREPWKSRTPKSQGRTKPWSEGCIFLFLFADLKKSGKFLTTASRSEDVNGVCCCMVLLQGGSGSDKENRGGGHPWSDVSSSDSATLTESSVADNAKTTPGLVHSCVFAQLPPKMQANATC